MEVTLVEVLIYGVAVGIPVAHYLLRRFRSGSDIMVSDPIPFGTFARINVGLAATYDSRRYVTVEYQEGNEPVDVQILLSTQQASRLAQLLRIAATDGRTLAIARAAARKR